MMTKLMIFFSITIGLYSCIAEERISMETSCDMCCDSTIIIQNNALIEGYTDRISYYPEDTIKLFVSSIDDLYCVELVKQSLIPTLALKTDSLKGMIQNYNQCAFKSGCNWLLSTKIVIPKDTECGYYTLDLKNTDATFKIPIVINVSSQNDILCVASTNTWHAYNVWSGASLYSCNLYDLNKVQPKYSEIVSMQRPIEFSQYPTKGLVPYKDHVFGAELGLIHWLERENFQYDVCTDTDIHNNPEILSKYKMVILNTHSEYWTEKAMNGVENYLSNGGNLCYIGGNGMYWKVTLNENIIECQTDNGNHISDGTPGGQWRNEKIDKPEEKILGASYTAAGYHTYMPYEIINEKHWLFDNMNVHNGDLFGQSLNNKFASGDETDKTTALSPQNLVLIARGLNNEASYEIGQPGVDMNGGAHMIYYRHEGGGAVFSTGSVTSSGSMLVDTIMSGIITNLIKNMTGDTISSHIIYP